MAMGRASGEGRVQNAILNALDSPLLYGSDISNAQRILFNIYTSSKHPIFVKEMREIDAFFDELNPDIKVIWGLSDDDTLDEDAKVTILATGLNNELSEELPDINHNNKEEVDYNAIIEQLYHPIRDGIHVSPQIEVPPTDESKTGIETEKETEVESEREKEINSVTTFSDDNPIEKTPTEYPVENHPEPNDETINRSVKPSLAERIRTKLLKLAEDLDIVTVNEE